MSKHRKKNNFIKQAGILAIAGIICRMIGILYRSPLTEIIGDEGNGYYTQAYNIYTIILLVASYSIPSAISKVIVQKLALKEYINAQRIFYCAIVYVAVVGGLASLFTFFGASLLAEHTSVIVLQVFAPTIFLSGLLGVLRGYFQAYNTMVQTSISQILEQIVNAVVSILAAYLMIKAVSHANATTQAIYGATGSAIGTGVGVFIALLFMLLVYLLNRGIIKKRLQLDSTPQLESYQEILKTIFFTVTPIILSTFIYNLSTVLNQTVFTKVLFYVKGFQWSEIASQYGIFAGKSIVIINIPIALATAMSAAMLPSISGTYAQGNVKETNQTVNMAIRSTLLLSIPAAVGLAVLSRPVIQILFPQKQSLMQASLLLKYLSITVVFYSLSTLTNTVLQGIGKVNLPVINALVSLTIQTAVLVIILLTTGWNTYALAIAAVVYSFLMCVLNGFSVRKNLGYQMNLKKTIVLPLSASTIMGTVAWFSYSIFYVCCKSNTISLLFAIIIAAIVYFILIIKLGGLNEEELEALPRGKIIITLAKKMRVL